MVGNETSFSAPVSRRKRFQRLDGVDLGQRAASAPRGRSRRGSAPAPRASRRCAVRVPSISVAFFTAFSSATGSLPRTGLPPAAVISRLSASAAVALSSAIDAPLCASAVSVGVSASGSSTSAVCFEMVAGAVGQLAVIDEDGRPAVLRHQRVGQRQRRMRDVGAADVEGPGHRVRIRQHQRVDAELGDLGADAVELVGLRLAGELRAVNRDRAERRRRALGPHRIERVAVDRDQFGAGLGAGRRQAARLPQKCAATDQIRGGRRPSDALPASFPAADRPAARRSRPCRRPAWRPAACSGRRRTRAASWGSTTAIPADPVKPVSQASRSSDGGDIFVLLLIGAGNHESGELAARQFLAKRRQPRRQRDAAFGLFECLEMGFEHRATSLRKRGRSRQS